MSAVWLRQAGLERALEPFLLSTDDYIRREVHFILKLLSDSMFDEELEATTPDSYLTDESLAAFVSNLSL